MTRCLPRDTVERRWLGNQIGRALDRAARRAQSPDALARAHARNVKVRELKDRIGELLDRPPWHDETREEQR